MVRTIGPALGLDAGDHADARDFGVGDEEIFAVGRQAAGLGELGGGRACRRRMSSWPEPAKTPTTPAAMSSFQIWCGPAIAM